MMPKSCFNCKNPIDLIVKGIDFYLYSCSVCDLKYQHISKNYIRVSKNIGVKYSLELCNVWHDYTYLFDKINQTQIARFDVKFFNKIKTIKDIEKLLLLL